MTVRRIVIGAKPLLIIQKIRKKYIQSLYKHWTLEDITIDTALVFHVSSLLISIQIFIERKFHLDISVATDQKLLVFLTLSKSLSKAVRLYFRKQ